MCMTLEKKNVKRCGSPVGWLQAVEPVVTVIIQSFFRHPVDHRSRKDAQEESIEPIEHDQVHRDSSFGQSANHPGPFTCAEKRLSDRDWKEQKKNLSNICLKILLISSTHLTFAACLLISDAISPPELPMPTTITRFSAKALPSL